MNSRPETGPGAGPIRREQPEGLLLAAGEGRRLGRGPKALLRHGGVTLAEHVADAMLAGGCGRVTVVTGAGAREVAEALESLRDVRCIENPDWSAGMGTSLRCGLEALGPGVNVLVMPVDRPGVSATAVERVIHAHGPGGITAAAHRDPGGRLRRGHPVLFAARWTGDAAAAAHGDVGARGLLSTQYELVRLVDCSDLDDGADVDTPDDLTRLAP
ncbi:nucleotidyltransferase family protein [uncultured Dietzia sp.]|uniref:nucleotidyltransferase family protein n=1 Tax=uncultured Dietzia sp. TaxID=395519 RepID=UPI0025CC0E55|nr:nucleotidyltransferase family protein [uncultured Dietzia sp.]